MLVEATALVPARPPIAPSSATYQPCEPSNFLNSPSLSFPSCPQGDGISVMMHVKAPTLCLPHDFHVNLLPSLTALLSFLSPHRVSALGGTLAAPWKSSKK